MSTAVFWRFFEFLLGGLLQLGERPASHASPLISRTALRIVQYAHLDSFDIASRLGPCP